MVPGGEKIDSDSGKDKSRSEPKRKPIGRICRIVLEELKLLEEQSETRDHEAETHEREACANPRQERALGG